MTRPYIKRKVTKKPPVLKKKSAVLKSLERSLSKPMSAEAQELEKAFNEGRVADAIDKLSNQSSKVQVHTALMNFVQEARGLDRSLAVLAEAVNLAVTPAAVFASHVVVKRVESAVEGLVNVSRQKTVNEVAAHGQVREEGKLGKVLNAVLPDGRYVEQRIQPVSTKPQAKSVEALLRAKGLDPKEHMTMTVSFSVDDYKLDVLKASGQITPDEYEATKPPLVWNLAAPKVKETIHE